MTTPIYRKTRRRESFWRHALAVIAIPGMATLVIPAASLWATGDFQPRWSFEEDIHYGSVGVGAFLIALGLILTIRSASLLRKAGRGTVAPWAPPRRLVVRGIYGRMRNPMVVGLTFVLTGEALILGAVELGAWALLFMLGHMLYIPFKEERDLARRFEDPYDLYRDNVPRWVPRLRPWEPTYEIERSDRWVSVDSPA